jgi:hypothetical protein
VGVLRFPETALFVPAIVRSSALEFKNEAQVYTHLILLNPTKLVLVYSALRDWAERLI